MALAPSTKFGPYEILMPLGAGGMGEVYRARDTRLSRDVAIKILPKEMSADPAHKQRFEREAKTISGLNHPNICTLYDVGSQDGVDYLVMECVEGETLAKRIEKGPLPLEQLLKYGAQIADALDKAHRAGIVHRDLKPSNVMLTSSGAKLLDFGLARASVAPASLAVTISASATPVTQEGTIVGTFQYMSPEQVEGKDLDGRSDIFSLGAVLYEMWTGQRAFAGKSHLSVASSILEREPAPITSLRPLTPSTLERTIKKCLEKVPDDRWQSASDLASQLKWISEGGTGSGSAPAVAAKSPARLITAGLAVLAAGTLAVIGLLLWMAKSSNERAVVRLALMMPPTDPLSNDNTPLALSPDGRRIILVVAHAGGTQLAVRDLSSFEVKLIPETEGAAMPFVSPDGEWVGFFANGKLKKISVKGGPAIVLASVQNFIGGSWLKSGTIVYTPDWSGGMYQVAAAGGKPELVMQLEPGKEQEWQWWPEALPNGDILYTKKTGEGSEESSVSVLSMKTRKAAILIDNATDAHYSPSGHLVYLSHGTIMAVPFDEKQQKITGTPLPVLQGAQTLSGGQFAFLSLARDGTLAYIPGGTIGIHNRLVSVDRSGKETVLPAQPQAYEDLTVSPDGKLLAMTIVGEQQWSVWIYDLQQKTLSRFTFDGDNRDPYWSADGKRVIYSSTRNGRRSLFWKPVNGPGGEEELGRFAAQAYPGSVSKDGQYLVYDIVSSGVYLLPLQGERKPKLLLNDPAAADEAISPDGKWIAYDSRESGRSEIYVRGFPTGAGKWQVSQDGGTHPMWSANGRELFFRTTANRSSLMSVSVSSGSEFVAGAQHALFVFSCNPAGHDYAPMPDGQSILCIKAPESETTAAQVNVVLNWAKELAGK